MKKRVAFFIAGILVLAILALGAVRIASSRGSGSSARRQNAPTVQVETPVRQTMTSKINYTGDVVAMQQADIVAKVGGTLEQVVANIGNRVTRGQLLAEIDPVELSAQAELTRANLATAQADFERAKQLLEQKLVSAQDYEKTEAQLKVAEANYGIAAARLGYTRIEAPFAGTVTRRYLDQGALLTANSSRLFTLMDFDSVRVVINVLEKDVPLMQLGARALVTSDAVPGQPRIGQVRRLSQAVDPGTRTMPVEVFVANQDHLLKPGMYAKVSLTLAEHPDVVTVPGQAILKDARGSYVYTVRDNKAVQLRVEPGIEQDGRTEVLSGLDGTESVITTGQQYVRDGSSVTIQP